MNRLREEFRQWWAWLVGLFIAHDSAKEEISTDAPEHQAEGDAPIAYLASRNIEPRVLKSQKNIRPDPIGRFFTRKTLAHLLDDLDYAFKSALIPFDKASWIGKDMAIGLKKLGAHVPAGIYVASERPTIKKEYLKSMPEMMSLSMGSMPEHERKEGWAVPDYLFGFKHDKKPYQIHSRLNGVTYYVGGAFGMGNRKRDKDQRKKLFWFGFFAIVDPITGAIDICDELRNQRIEVGKQRTKFTRRQWTHQTFFERPEKGEEWHRREVKDKAGRGLFSMLYHTWAERTDGWSVAVSKQGDRVTFGVPVDVGATAAFFSDRDKTIKTANGSTKRIIHIAREHSRLTASGKLTTVKTHLRGLDKFEWKGYHVVVRSPEFHGILNMDQPPMEDFDDIRDIPDGAILASKAGKLMADVEDVGIQRYVRSTKDLVADDPVMDKKLH